MVYEVLRMNHGVKHLHRSNIILLRARICEEIQRQSRIIIRSEGRRGYHTQASGSYSTIVDSLHSLAVFKAAASIKLAANYNSKLN